MPVIKPDAQRVKLLKVGWLGLSLTNSPTGSLGRPSTQTTWVLATVTQGSRSFAGSVGLVNKRLTDVWGTRRCHYPFDRYISKLISSKIQICLLFCLQVPPVTFTFVDVSSEKGLGEEQVLLASINLTKTFIENHEFPFFFGSLAWITPSYPMPGQE